MENQVENEENRTYKKKIISFYLNRLFCNKNTVKLFIMTINSIVSMMRGECMFSSQAKRALTFAQTLDFRMNEKSHI